jgi:protein phosphatase
VADGVGGEAGGEEASSLALDTVVTYVTKSMRCFYKLDHRVQDELMEELVQLVQESDAMVRSRADTDPKHASMATTLTMAHILWPRAYVVQIGDSRCYRMRSSDIAQVTKDQTVAQELVDSGALSPDDLDRSPYSHVLTQAIGGKKELNAEISNVELQRGDSLLLCSDGLTGHVSDQQIAELMRTGESAQAVAESLCEAALEAGGTDNVTVVVSRFG